MDYIKRAYLQDYRLRHLARAGPKLILRETGDPRALSAIKRILIYLIYDYSRKNSITGSPIDPA